MMGNIFDAGRDAINQMVAEERDSPEQIWDQLELLGNLVEIFSKAGGFWQHFENKGKFSDALRRNVHMAIQIDALVQDYARPKDFKNYPEFCLMMACVLPRTMPMPFAFEPGVPGRPLRLFGSTPDGQGGYMQVLLYDGKTCRYATAKKDLDGKIWGGQLFHNPYSRPFHEKLNAEYTALAESAADAGKSADPLHLRNLSLYFALGMGGGDVMPDFEKAMRYAGMACRKWDAPHMPNPVLECFGFYKKYLPVVLNTDRYLGWKIPEEDKKIIASAAQGFQGFLRAWAGGKFPAIPRQDVLMLIKELADISSNEKLAQLYGELSGKERKRDEAADRAVRAQMRALLGRAR